MPYFFRPPDDFKGDTFHTYTEEVPIVNNVAVCSTATAKEILKQNRFEELPNSTPPKQEMPVPPVIESAVYEVEYIAPKK